MKFDFKFALVFISIFLVFSDFCMGQSIQITVKNTENSTLPGAVVQLGRISNAFQQSNITNTSGTVQFDVKINTKYTVKVSYLGFKTLQDTILVKSDKQKFEFKLSENAITIKEANINAQKPLIRQEDDKMIIDPMPLANSSSNTMEILEKTPGLYVDQDGNIYLSSTMSATIYINGNELKMSNEDIATLLRSLPPGSVERIEVMRTPSTKFDASSSGGIINIVLKKGVKLGQTGSISMGMNQGFYGNRFAGFSLNNNSGKLTSYLNVNYNHNETREIIHSVRSLVQDTILHQTSINKPVSEQGYIGYGISYDATPKLNLSYDGRLSGSLPSNSQHSNSLIQNTAELLLYDNDNLTKSNSEFLNIQQDFGIIKKFDTIGSDLNTKLSYSFNNNTAWQKYTSDYSFPIIQVVLGDGLNRQQRHYVNFQSDLTYIFRNKIKLEAGIKSSYQDYRSSSDYYTDKSGTRLIDPQRSNSFNYQENINSAYAQASKTLGKIFTLKLGVRMEQTYMKGHQTIPADTSFLINRADWFPYIYIYRDLIHIFGIKLQGYLIYRRTINRPDYQNLNPYIKYVDDFLYETGNPAMKPQFTDNYEINLSYNDIPILAFGQNLTTDIFSNVLYRNPAQQGVAIRTYDNLGTNRESYFRLIIGIPPGSKYFFALGAMYNYSDYHGFYENKDFTFKRGSWRLFTFQSLNIFKQTKLTLNGFMMVDGSQNFYTLKNFGQLNMGLTQTLFQKKLTITLSMRDMLRTMTTYYQFNQLSMNSYGDRYMDNQRFGINLRYAFGMKKKENKNNFGEPEGEY